MLGGADQAEFRSSAASGATSSAWAWRMRKSRFWRLCLEPFDQREGAAGRRCGGEHVRERGVHGDVDGGNVHQRNRGLVEGFGRVHNELRLVVK